ncbi:MAG: hypothetical protein IJQ21_09560 [Lachnospiraceae bacterium]|nr:hypothetical protein [Lachnospiraceae bacterium]
MADIFGAIEHPEKKGIFFDGLSWRLEKEMKWSHPDKFDKFLDILMGIANESEGKYHICIGPTKNREGPFKGRTWSFDCDDDDAETLVKEIKEVLRDTYLDSWYYVVFTKDDVAWVLYNMADPCIRSMGAAEYVLRLRSEESLFSFFKTGMKKLLGEN